MSANTNIVERVINVKLDKDGDAVECKWKFDFTDATQEQMRHWALGNGLIVHFQAQARKDCKTLADLSKWKERTFIVRGIEIGRKRTADKVGKANNALARLDNDQLRELLMEHAKYIGLKGLFED